MLGKSGGKSIKKPATAAPLESNLFSCDMSGLGSCGITCKQVAAVFPQLERLRVEASGALVGVGAVPLPHGLHVLAAVRVQEQHHWVVLDVVESLDCSGGDVQKGVFVL